MASDILTASAADFFEEWASIRTSLASGQLGGIDGRLRDLEGLASNARQRVLISPVEIQFGARSGFEPYRQSGLNRLEGASREELLEALNALTDLTILGAVEVRRELIFPAITSEFDEADPAMNFILDAGLADATAITGGAWEAPRTLTAPIQREVRLWVAWAALEAWLAYRRPAYLDVISSAAIAFGPGEPSSWEYTAVQAITHLSKNEVEEATWLLKSLLRRAQLPDWARRRLTRVMSMYSPLAGRELQSWRAAAPLPLLGVDEARSDREEAAFAFAKLVDPDATHQQKRLQKVAEGVAQQPWLAFSIFIACEAEDVRTKAGEILLASIKRPDDVRAWPWAGRARPFAESCLSLADSRLALDLLVESLEVVGDASMRRACVKLLNTASPEDLITIQTSMLVQRLKGEFQQLDHARQSMLNRGGVFRAVIDGSNLAWAGRSGRAGAQPSLQYLDQAMSSLKKEGFAQIELFFDASARHRLSSSDWRRVEDMQASRKATIVRGVADPAIIEAFLEAPRHTWIVTGDDYKDWLGQFSLLRPWWPMAKLGFYVGQDDRLRWERPLNTSDQARP